MGQRNRSATASSASPEPVARKDKQPVQGNAEEAIKSDVKSVQHLFLQAFLSRRIMSEEAADELLTAYCRICKG